MTPLTTHITAVKIGEPEGWRAGLVWPLLGLFIGALFLKSYVSGDIWFLLLAGRYVLETGTVPQHEFFTYISAGKPEIFGGWGFGTLFELIKNSFGTAAIYYAYAILWAATFLVGIATWRAGDRKTWNEPFTLPDLAAVATACFLIYYAVVTRSWMRPEITMYLLMGIGFLLFEADRHKTRQSRSLIIYPLLVWLEAWFHSAGIIMLLLPAAYATESIAGRFSSQVRTNVRAWELVGGWAACLTACIILPMFNPNGAAQVYLHVLITLQKIELFQTLQLSALSGLDKLPIDHLVPTHNLLEYMPAWQIPVLMQRFALLAFASVFFLVFTKRKLFHACLLVPLGLLALIHNRGLGPWAMIMLPLMCAQFSNMYQRLKAMLSAVAFRRMLVSALLCAAGSALVVAVSFADMGMPRNTLPLPGGIQAIRTAHPQGGNVFASYLLSAPAAYALGKGYQVPIGAHIMFYYPETRKHFVKTASAREDYLAELDRHDIIAVIYEAANGATGEISLLPAMLTVNKQWRLASADDEGVTFVRIPDSMPASTDSERLAEINLFWHAVQRQAVEALSHPSAQTERSIVFAGEQLRIIETYRQMPAQALDLLTRNLATYTAQLE